MTRKEILKRHRIIFEAQQRRFEAWVKSGGTHEMRPRSSMPRTGFEDLCCEAKTRAGTPCKRRDIYLNGRCKLHGGLSTGPRTAEGKAKVALNGKPKKAEICEQNSCENVNFYQPFMGFGFSGPKKKEEIIESQVEQKTDREKPFHNLCSWGDPNKLSHSVHTSDYDPF